MSARSPMRVLIFFVGTALFLSVALVVQSEPPRKPAVERVELSALSFLNGTWMMEGKRRVVYEVWDCSDSTVYRGAGYGVKIDTATQARDSSLGELVRIEKTDSGLFFVALVDHNSAEVPFKLIRFDSLGAVFENPTHDFPQRVIYKEHGADSLYARIEGKRGEEDAGIDFRYVRVK